MLLIWLSKNVNQKIKKIKTSQSPKNLTWKCISIELRHREWVISGIIIIINLKSRVSNVLSELVEIKKTFRYTKYRGSL